MTGGEEPEDIDAALSAAFSVAPEAVRMMNPAARRAREKAMRLSPTDGRRGHRTGRVAQFNVKCTPELKKRVVQASRDHKRHIAELVEEALETYLATLAQGGSRA